MISSLFHIVESSTWARNKPVLYADSLGPDGLVHCSFRYQVPGVVRRFYAGTTPLAILEIDGSRLGAVVRLEPGSEGEVDREGIPELFPHVYGPIPRTSVLRVHDRETFESLDVTLSSRLQGYRISDDPRLFDEKTAVSYLRHESYWAKGREAKTIIRSFDRSWVVGSYAPDGSMVGMARVISDWCTMYYLADLFVLARHRGRGLGTAMIDAIVHDRRLRGLSGFLLTADAHELYERFGFERSPDTQRRFMRRPRGKT